MNIIKITENNILAVQEFILPFEYTCVLLAQNVRQKSENLFAVVKEDKLNTKDDIIGVLNLDKNFLHCFPHPYDEKFLEELLSSFLEEKEIKCITGQKKFSEFLINLLAKKNLCPKQTNYYKTMILPGEMNNPPEELNPDDEIKRAVIDDLESLVELQKNYLAKEVAVPGQVISDLEAAVSLKGILKKQLCFVLYSDSEPVAKANTNAIGYNFIQIGGVYTHPLYRKNYYAWHLMKIIAERIQKNGKKVTLFVKINNAPAKQLYKREGFIEKDDFIISYF